MVAELNEHDDVEEATKVLKQQVESALDIERTNVEPVF